MESEAEPQTPQRQPPILYDTLSFHSSPVATPSSPVASGSLTQSSPPLDRSPEKTYNVFRNEISLSFSAPTLEEDTDAPDFLSLNLIEEEKEEDASPTVTGDGQILEPATPVTPVELPEPRLETGSWFRRCGKLKKPLLKLHEEIMDFCEFLSPTPEEEASRNAAIDRVFEVIKYIWPDAKVEIFGSFSTGLYLPTSDIDVVILESGLKTPKVGLVALSRALSQKFLVKKMQVIANARVPIIKFIEKKSGIAFDISFDVANGPKAAEYIKEAMTKWPPLRPLCLILKVFLQQRELNEVYSGGLGSYALLTMLMAVLQSVYDSQSCLEHNWGFLLVHFFEFYAFKLNTAEVGISCRGPNFFSKSKRGFLNKGRPFLISIEDPQTPENDIGKNSFNYLKIRSAFASAFASLTDRKTILNLGPNKSLLGTIINPDPVLLDRKGGSDGNMTFSSLLPGSGEPVQHLNGWDEQEITCNWPLDQEVPLPRGDGSAGDFEDGAGSSGKKRKAKSSKKKQKSNKKIKENGEEEKDTSSKIRSSTKKKRWRHRNNDAIDVGRFVAGSPY
ncbi:uncharacterized protein [Rutidosis leptorrhynchoides]|uniref:uncharacterized protein n=1 Tax=Rutidosis leptorrhynchoides TaxID=125765 RepID=UPI003A9A5BFB